MDNQEPTNEKTWARSYHKLANGEFVMRDTASTGEIADRVISPQDVPMGASVEVEPQTPPPPSQPPASEPTPPKGSVVVKTGGDISGLVPTTMQEAWLFCSKMAQSFNLPKAMYEFPKLPQGVDASNVNIMEVATARALHALQLGMEVGLPPGQAVQSIAVTNGVGTIWGDAMLGIVKKSGLLDEFTESFEGGDMWLERDANGAPKTPNRAYKAVCRLKRRGKPELVREFSVQDAMDAGLWGKSGTWQSYKGRMMQMKARSYALRDEFPDVLKGLCHSIEEMEGVEPIDVTPKRADATDITPENGANKLDGLLASKGVKPTTTA